MTESLTKPQKSSGEYLSKIALSEKKKRKAVLERIEQLRKRLKDPK